MNPGDIAPMVVGVTLIVVTGGVVLLRPLVRRLGDLMDLMIADRRRDRQPQPLADPAGSERIVNLMESLDDRLRRLEDRQDFTDALLGGQPRDARTLPGTQSRPPGTK